MRVWAKSEMPGLFRRIYTLDLLVRGLARLSLWQVLSLMYRLARTRLFGVRHVVYGRAAYLLGKQSDQDIKEFVVQCVTDWSTFEHMLNTELKAWPGHILPDDPQGLWRDGAQFWIGRWQGQAATIAVSRRSQQVRAFFFPLQDGQALISHCGTVPCLRGRGLYPAMLTQIIRELAVEGVAYVVIHCADWNVPSRRGIERAGFNPIGTGLQRRGGKTNWIPLPGAVREPEPLPAS